MFGLLAFFFKLFFSTFFSIIYTYFIIENDENNLVVILLCILGASIASIINYIPDANKALSVGISIFILIYFSNKLFNNQNFNEKILFTFPCILGVMIGLGLIFQALILLFFLYVVKKKLNYFHTTPIIHDKSLDEDKEIID